MKIYSKYLIVFIAVVSFSNFIPYFYTIMFAKPNNKDFIYYSEIIDDFIIKTFTETREFIRKDKAGNTYSESELKKLLPQTYVRDLLLKNEYNELINGKIVNAEDMMLKNIHLSMKPLSISEDKIRIRMMPYLKQQAIRHPLKCLLI